ncbi:MAG: LUD domain-containing protein [Tissierellia bacterium]|nr:LUD domain-containing protein [Tissierellia bacterium]
MDNNILKAKASLEKNGFKVEAFNNVKEVKDFLLEEISKSKSIAFGGSMTLFDMDLYEEFKEKGNETYWHWMAENKGEELKKAMDTDIYISSTNAVTLDGKLVSMDGVGNRVASLIYGHEKVYIIAGRNKISKDYEDGKRRIENIAAPKNAQRLDTKTPCKTTGKCSDCNTVERICRVEIILHRNPTGANINVLLVDEDLGY